MKKFSTPTLAPEATQEKTSPKEAPRKSTIAFLRQFARVYRPAPAASMPGFVLN